MWQACLELFKTSKAPADDDHKPAKRKPRIERPALIDLLGDDAASRTMRRDCTTCMQAIPDRSDFCDPYVYCAARPIAGVPMTAPKEKRFERRGAVVGCTDLYTPKAAHDVE